MEACKREETIKHSTLSAGKGLSCPDLLCSRSITDDHDTSRLDAVRTVTANQPLARLPNLAERLIIFHLIV